MPHEFLPQPGDRLWTPADWAWAGGLLNILLPGLHFGVPVVARKFEKFDPEAALRLMADLKVRNTFIPPTALRMLRTVGNPRGRFDLDLRTVASGRRGARGRDLRLGAARRSGSPSTSSTARPSATSCSPPARRSASRSPAASGRPVPGHDGRGDPRDGTVCGPGELGQIAVRRPDPVMFLGYWNNPAATAKKFIGDWMTTGDQGAVDGEGYIRFVGRDDDVITSSGYRIGPTEIEDCLIRHPAVALAAAVGKPDPLRTEIVKAFVVLEEGRRALRCARRRNPGLRARPALGARVPARDRLPPEPAAHDDRQGNPPLAARGGVVEALDGLPARHKRCVRPLVRPA